MNVLNVVPMRTPPPPPVPQAPHVTVLAEEALRALDVSQGGVFVDATLGAGGHAEAILLQHPGVRVIGLDRDDDALELSRKRLAHFGDRFVALKAEFSDIERVVTELGVGRLDGLLADIGVSSMQIDDPLRGMSFRGEGPLDMRMDASQGETALDLIDRLDDDDLADVIFKLGEERRSRRIARCIKRARQAGELSTTLDLRRAVVRAVGPARIGGVDPATRTFQALRIAVNGELDQLAALLEAAPRVLRLGAVFAVISFHSLEDRLVKRAFHDHDTWAPLTKKPITASDAEVAENPRARSAKLRAARRVDTETSFDGGHDA